jgi:uncharacterized protein (DUF58 family)
MFSVRRLIAFLCVVAVILAAITPAAPGLLWAILVPLLFFVAAAAIAPISRESKNSDAPPFPLISVVTSRAPPTA